MLGLMATAGFRMVPSFSRILNNLQSLRYGWVSVDVLLNEFKNHSQRNKIQKDTDESILEHAEVSFFNEVQVSNVSFSYSEDKAKILNDINLVIPKGEVIGMEGESGSGKSTIVNLILGLIDPTLGEIKVDGQKLINSQIDQWQRMIGYVPQEIYLLDDTIRRNIAFGVEDESINDDRVREVLRIARLDNLIKHSSEGLGLLLGKGELG